MSRDNHPRTVSYTALLLASAAVVASVYMLSAGSHADFTPYFGPLGPALAAAMVCVAGLAAFHVLQKHAGLSVCDAGASRQRFAIAAVLALPFMIAVTLADVFLRFGADINVGGWPALVFYPAMAYVAQLALHVVPLALVLLLFHAVFPAARRNWLTGIAIVLVSGLEAAFQVASLQSPLLTAYVATSLFFFGIVELSLYWRFDYVTMYVFRLVYYSYWHLIWGQVRLIWLL